MSDQGTCVASFADQENIPPLEEILDISAKGTEKQSVADSESEHRNKFSQLQNTEALHNKTCVEPEELDGRGVIRDFMEENGPALVPPPSSQEHLTITTGILDRALLFLPDGSSTVVEKTDVEDTSVSDPILNEVKIASEHGSDLLLLKTSGSEQTSSGKVPHDLQNEIVAKTVSTTEPLWCANSNFASKEPFIEVENVAFEELETSQRVNTSFLREGPILVVNDISESLETRLYSIESQPVTHPGEVSIAETEKVDPSVCVSLSSPCEDLILETKTVADPIDLGRSFPGEELVLETNIAKLIDLSNFLDARYPGEGLAIETKTIATPSESSQYVTPSSAEELELDSKDISDNCESIQTSPSQNPNSSCKEPAVETKTLAEPPELLSCENSGSHREVFFLEAKSIAETIDSSTDFQSYTTPRKELSIETIQKSPFEGKAVETECEASETDDAIDSDPMPTQVDQVPRNHEDRDSGVSSEASPAHSSSCKTEAMTDSLSNDRDVLLDENTNPRSDCDNNEEGGLTAVVETDLALLSFCTPKRKNENEIAVTNGDGQDLLGMDTPVIARKPLIGVASVNRRPAKSEQKPTVEDQPTTNQSEAGPQVAEFTEEEFRSCAEVFKDSESFDFLQKAGSSAAFQESALSRLSLYVKFDPLVKAKTPVKEQLSHVQTTEQHIRFTSDNLKVCKSETIQEESDVMMEKEKSSPVAKLIDYTPDKRDIPRSTRMVSVEPVQKEQQQKMFSDGDMKKAMQIQDLLYRERILRQEREIRDWEKKNIDLQISMRTTKCIMEEMLSMVQHFQGKKEQDRMELAERNQKLLKERDQALEDLQNVEVAFSDLHRRYEKTKSILENMKQNESTLRDQLSESVNRLKKQEQMYDILRKKTEEKLESANTQIETAKRIGESEIAVLGAQLKKAEMKIGSLERSLDQKNQEYTELSSIYDDLIARVGLRN